MSGMFRELTFLQFHTWDEYMLHVDVETGQPLRLYRDKDSGCLSQWEAQQSNWTENKYGNNLFEDFTGDLFKRSGSLLNSGNFAQPNEPEEKEMLAKLRKWRKRRIEDLEEAPPLGFS